MNDISLKTLSTFFVVVFFFLVAVKVFDVSYPVALTQTTKTTELSVVGEGKVDVVPDTAYVDVGITIDNSSTAETAQKTLSDKNNDVITALKTMGIPESDIKTSNFSVYPNYSYIGGKNILSGYNGNVSISVKTTDLTRAGQIVTEATKAGANQIQGTRFVVDQPEKYREQARDKAIANAREQAQKLASSLGITLGRVVNVVESNSNPSVVMPLMYDKAAGMGGANPVPDLQPGTQTLTSTVTLYFEKR
jgi:uncharacterized protein YggE